MQPLNYTARPAAVFVSDGSTLVQREFTVSKLVRGLLSGSISFCSVENKMPHCRVVSLKNVIKISMTN